MRTSKRRMSVTEFIGPGVVDADTHDLADSKDFVLRRPFEGDGVDLGSVRFALADRSPVSGPGAGSSGPRAAIRQSGEGVRP